MNMWGFTPDYFKYSEDYFVDFLKANIGNIKSEYFIPLMVNKLINEKDCYCESSRYYFQVVRCNLCS